MKTIDERSTDYANNVQISPGTYKGDVETAYCVGAGDQQRINDERVKKLLEFLGDEARNHLGHECDKSFKNVIQKVRDTFKWYWE